MKNMSWHLEGIFMPILNSISVCNDDYHFPFFETEEIELGIVKVTIIVTRPSKGAPTDVEVIQAFDNDTFDEGCISRR